MKKDFEPGDVIIFHALSRFLRDGGPYTVLDPVRTEAGKLRLRGPRGGYMTTWWNYYESERNQHAGYWLEVA